MSGRPPGERRLPTVRPDADYPVGFGRPPVETRFQPGQSGNPKGRPRGTKNRAAPPGVHEQRLKAIIMQEAYRTVTVNDAKGPVEIPIAQAIIRSLAVNAAKGNQRAQRLFTELLATTERDNRQLNDQFLDVAITYKVEWEKELERRRATGAKGPEPLPHPDHVVVDLQTGAVRIVGPATSAEKAQWVEWVAHAPVLATELEELEQRLAADPRCSNRAALRREIVKTKRALEMLAEMAEKLQNR